MGHMPLPKRVTKTPTLVIYWADTRKLLTHTERKLLEQKASVVSVTPREVLLEVSVRGERRKVCVVGVFDPLAPVPPSPKPL